MIRAYLSVCTWRAIEFECAQAIAATLLRRGEDVQFMWGGAVNHALIDFSRSMEATSFLNNPSRGDVLVFIDSDIWFDPEDVVKIVRLCADGHDVCGGGYVVRSQGDTRPALKTLTGSKLTFGPNQPPLEVEYMSTGFLAIHRRVLERLAEFLPLCRTGSNLLRPFFQPFVYHPEGQDYPTYLTEDWAFCRRALDTGFKIWLDPTIRLGHMGFKVFTINDIVNNGKVVTGTFIEGIGPMDMTGIAPDYAEYTEQPLDDVYALIRQGDAPRLAALWEETKPRRPHEVTAFYRNADYILDLANFNMSEEYVRDTVIYLQGLDGKAVCDFGGGIGTLAIMLDSLACDTTYVELPSPHRKFAEWRFAKRGLNIHVGGDLCALHDMDCILAIDVMEHIHPKLLPDYAWQMYAALKPGGEVRVRSGFPAKSHPMHFDSAREFGAAMQAVGFQGGPVLWRKPDVSDKR